MYNLKENLRAIGNSDSYENDYLTDRLRAQRSLSMISLMIPAGLLFLFFVTPHASDLSPNPLVIYISAIIIVQAAIRLCLNWKKVLNDKYQIICAILDFVALAFILVAYTVTYEVPLSVALKSPTANIFFIYLSSRIILFNRSILLKTGLIAIMTWVGLVCLALVDPMFEGRTSSFVEYMTSFKILLGAEIERILQFGLITAVLYAFLHSARHDPPTGFLRRPFFLQSLTRFLIATKNDSLAKNYAIIELRAENIADVGKVYNTVFNLLRDIPVLNEIKAVKIGRLSDQSLILSIEYSKDEYDLKHLLSRIYDELNAKAIARLATKCPEFILGGCVVNPQLSAHQHLTHTDIAIREAIATGKHCLVFDDKMLDKIKYKQSIERAIKLGLQKETFSVAYQPIVDMMTNKPIGFEAFIRLQGEDDEPISPVEFIPIAESAGLISDITDYLCDKIALEAVEIKELYKEFEAQPYINVNISPTQLIDVNRAVRALNRARESGVKINVEITESTILNEFKANEAYNELRKEGFSIAIDDFGTGYSSIQRLEQSQFSTLKVDQSFVSNIQDPQAYAFLEAIINLARTSARFTIVEGVETLEQKLLLLKMGVRYCQGYYWARPMNVEALSAYLTEIYGFTKTVETQYEFKNSA